MAEPREDHIVDEFEKACKRMGLETNVGKSK